MARAKKDEEKFTLTIDGVEHEIVFDDFESWEIEFIEDLMDAPIVAVDFRRWKAIRAIVYIIRHRTNPKVEFADLESLKPSDLEGESNGDRPTAAAKPKRAGTTRAKSGDQS